MSAREEILARVRAALEGTPSPAEPPRPAEPPSRPRRAAERARLGALFARRVAEYRATVGQVTEAELARAIGRALAARGVSTLVVPEDLPAGWLADAGDVRIIPDRSLATARVAESDGVLTGCALAIAETGTLVLDCGAAQGRRAISLLPDFHLCVVRTDQVVPGVQDAIDLLADAARDGRPITFISGPSATSDIELSRVEGVHGPRTLQVLIVEGQTPRRPTSPRRRAAT